MTDAATKVTTGRTGGVALITINRPERLNALDPETRQLLLAALDAAGAPEIRAVVLTGAGRAFCVGHDLGSDDEDADIGRVVRDAYNPIARALMVLDKPVIAAVNGPAVGAGMGFALACDLVVIGAEAYLSCAFSKVGLVPDSGASAALVATLGHARAFELAMSGRRIDATEALALGLVNRVVASETVLAEAQTWADELAAGPGLAAALTKRLFRGAAYLDPAELLRREALSQGVAARGAEHAEGAGAFREKRAASFPPEAGPVPGDVPSGWPT